MRPLYQNKRELNSSIQDEGCYLIDLLNIYQDIANHNIGYDVVNAIYVMSTRVKYLGKDCTVYDIPGISQIISGLTGIPVYMEAVKEYEEYNYLVGVFRRERVTHYVVLNDDKTVKWDPWYPSSKTAREGILHDLRYINARLL